MFDLHHNNNGDGYETAELTIDEYIELFPEPEHEILNTMDVTKKIYAIRDLEKRIEMLELQDKEAHDFYTSKVKKCKETIDYIKRNILGYLHNQGLKNILTPAGTAYQKEITIKSWPADAELIAWAQAHCPEGLRTKLEPDKRLLSAHVQRSGIVPEGYAETSETRLYVK